MGVCHLTEEWATDTDRRGSKGNGLEDISSAPYTTVNAVAHKISIRCYKNVYMKSSLDLEPVLEKIALPQGVHDFNKNLNA